MKELKIVAAIATKEEFREELLPVLKTLVDETRKEEGNISYELHQDTQNPLKFVIVEVWESQDAIDKHNRTPHFLAFARAIKGRTDSLTIDVIEKIY